MFQKVAFNANSLCGKLLNPLWRFQFLPFSEYPQHELTSILQNYFLLYFWAFQVLFQVIR